MTRNGMVNMVVYIIERLSCVQGVSTSEGTKNVLFWLVDGKERQQFSVNY